jgi:hypothetical protein
MAHLLASRRKQMLYSWLLRWVAEIRPTTKNAENLVVDVMITIFLPFLTIFGGKKIPFLSKTKVVIKILHYLALF